MTAMNKRSFFVISTREKQIIRVVARKVDPVISPRSFRIGMVFVLLPRKQQKRIALLQDDFLPLPIHLIDERPFPAYNKMQRIIFPRTPLDLFDRAAPLFTAPQDGDPIPFMVEQRFSVDIYFDITHFSPFPFRLNPFVRCQGQRTKGAPCADRIRSFFMFHYNLYLFPVNSFVSKRHNNPPFSYHLENVNNYMGLSSKQIENRFSPDLNLIPHSLGMGSLSLPGDASSPSRFIRAFFYKYHQDKKTSIDEERKAYFDLLAKVKVLKGEAYDGDNPEYTVYSSCYDIDDFSLFYITYDSNVCQKFTYEKTDDALVHNPLKNQILFALGK